jgi:hypothetical protein
MTEKDQSTAAKDEKKPSSGKKRKKKLSSGKKLFLFVSGTAFTALLGWSINYYLPGLLSSNSESAPIVADVNDNPSTIGTFAASTETILLPPAARKDHVSNPPFSFCDEFHSWAAGLGGIDAGKTEFRVVVQGNSDLPVILDGMSARIIRRVSTAGAVPVGCGSAGNATVRSIQINLDANPPLAEYHTVYGKQPFAFTLNKGETEIFDITAVSNSPNVVTVWDLVLNAVIDGQEHTYVIEDRGRPFETAGWTPGTDKNTYTWTMDWYPRSPFT